MKFCQADEATMSYFYITKVTSEKALFNFSITFVIYGLQYSFFFIQVNTGQNLVHCFLNFNVSSSLLYLLLGFEIVTSENIEGSLQTVLGCDP